MAVTVLLNLPATTILPAGSFTSSNFTCPTGIGSVTIALTVQVPDITDITKTLSLALWRETSPGSGTFQFDCGFTWVGGTLNKQGLPASPFMVVAVGPLAGTLCQVRATLSKPLLTAVLVTSN